MVPGGICSRIERPSLKFNERQNEVTPRDFVTSRLRRNGFPARRNDALAKFTRARCLYDARYHLCRFRSTTRPRRLAFRQIVAPIGCGNYGPRGRASLNPGTRSRARASRVYGLSPYFLRRALRGAVDAASESIANRP